jgi:hypothetical protein
MRLVSKLLLYASLLFTISSCTFFDKESFDPAYIIISEVSLVTTLAQGYPSHNIQDVWVYIDGEVLGVFPLPARIPVVSTGENERFVRIVAGIRQNAQANVPVEYPFFRPIQQTMVLEAGIEYYPEIVFQYTDQAIFDIVEGFEGSHIFTENLGGSPENQMIATNENVRSGSRSGLVRLMGDQLDAQITTISTFLNANNRGGSVYLELDYLTDTEVFLGVVVETASERITHYKLGLRPNTEWNRIYLDLTAEVSNSFVVNYKPVIGIERRDLSKPFTSSFFDNIKLVHF